MNLNTHQPQNSYTMTRKTRPLKFYSRQFQDNQTSVPVEATMALSASLSILCFVGACFTIQHLLIIGCALMLCSWSLAGFVYIASNNLMNENRRKHQLILSGDLITVSLYDFTSHRKTVQHLSLRRIDSAEYTGHKDKSTLTLRGHDIDDSPIVINIPLGTFGNSAEQKVISYLKRYKIDVTTRPSQAPA